MKSFILFNFFMVLPFFFFFDAVFKFGGPKCVSCFFFKLNPASEFPVCLEFIRVPFRSREPLHGGVVAQRVVAPPGPAIELGLVHRDVTTSEQLLRLVGVLRVAGDADGRGDGPVQALVPERRGRTGERRGGQEWRERRSAEQKTKTRERNRKECM